MEFSIYDAIDNGFNHIVVITQKDNVDFLRTHLSERLPDTLKLDVISQELSDLPEGSTYSGKREKPWGTAHAVWSARNVINSPFAVINADDYYGKAAYKNAADFIRSTTEEDAYGLLAYTLSDTLSEHGSVSRGVCERDGEALRSVVETIKITKQNGNIIDLDTGREFSGEELVSMNFWVCRPSIFEHIEKDLRTFLKDDSNIPGGEVYIPFVIQEMLQEGKTSVTVIPSDSKWFGVTYAEDKEKAMAALQEMTSGGSYTTPLWPADNSQ